MSTPYEALIFKIFRFMLSYEHKKLLKIIRKHDKSMDEKLEEMSTIVTDYVIKHNIKPDENRQDFIINKINTYLVTHFNHLCQDNCKFVDIGGGNGNVISGLRNHIGIRNKTKKEDFICVETETDWGETYPFNNENITYLLLKGDEEINLSIEPHSVDVILCMCSLHHMRNDTIFEMLTNMKRILKPEGKILIKEHDVTGALSYIMCEHHLYHLLDCAYNGEQINIREHYDNFIYNFKSKEHWTELFELSGFRLNNIHNRFLYGDYVKDDKNVTQLYWAVYEHAPSLF